MEELRKSAEETKEEASSQEEKQPPKHQWQATKEGWYEHLNVTVKQLDIIIGLAVAGLIIVAVIIGLDAAGVF